MVRREGGEGLDAVVGRGLVAGGRVPVLGAAPLAAGGEGELAWGGKERER